MKKSILQIAGLFFFPLAFVISTSAQPGWTYVNTGINHSILIQTIPTINSIPIDTGDVIGVFYMVGNQEVCGGYTVWEGNQTAVTAWGDDTQTAAKDGFSTGEVFNWKIWHFDMNAAVVVYPVYMTIGFPNTKLYSTNGLSGISMLFGTAGTPQLSYSANIANVSCYGNGDGHIEITPTGGVAPYYYHWNSGYTGSALYNLNAGNYTVTIYDSNASSDPFNWTFSNTGSIHTILFEYMPQLDGNNIASGDKIGAFFSNPATGNYQCAGYFEWSGNYPTALSIWGDDATTAEKDGFSENEAITWFLYDVSASRLVPMNALYQTIFPNTGYYTTNGISGLQSLSGTTPAASGLGDSLVVSIGITEPYPLTMTSTVSYNSSLYPGPGVIVVNVSGGSPSGQNPPYSMLWSNGYVGPEASGLTPGWYFLTVTDLSGCTLVDSFLIEQQVQSQSIHLPYYWSIFSTYMLPSNANISAVLAPVVSNLSIVKDWNGQSYWPQYNVNLIGNMTPGAGYQIKMLAADTLVISGTIIEPAAISINLPYYWSILGYVRTSPAPIATMLSPIVSSISIVKDGFGNIYWPQFSVNTIGSMKPGEGYQIKMLQAASLVYPPN